MCHCRLCAAFPVSVESTITDVLWASAGLGTPFRIGAFIPKYRIAYRAPHSTLCPLIPTTSRSTFGMPLISSIRLAGLIVYEPEAKDLLVVGLYDCGKREGGCETMRTV